ncbi:hypothetical protein RFI_32719 [Reticulomyxa filosa]|uniref:Uncharacterized protein n=1 Tax=Reticulomyxa filosa TaxID=46433 RepID=X6LSP3_RETFI|nr:hypothetical protein RFI_32719 [Reticulomyxa filosa]|eukprot:ETO04674.1 hypothetical protein RFI_32719 [Reticulomyxa filosa]
MPQLQWKEMNSTYEYVRYSMRGPLSGMVISASLKQVISEEKEFEETGLILSGSWACDPNKYLKDIQQPFVLVNCNKNTKNVKVKLKDVFLAQMEEQKNKTKATNPYLQMKYLQLNNITFDKYFHQHSCVIGPIDEANVNTNIDNENADQSATQDKPCEQWMKENLIYEFPFQLIRCKHGWDLIIPNFIIEYTSDNQPVIKNSETGKIGRLFWNALFQGGGRVIGIKHFNMCNAFSDNGEYFNMYDIDSISSIHYWLKYVKLDFLKSQYFKLPRNKRDKLKHFLFPFDLWPNFFGVT